MFPVIHQSPITFDSQGCSLGFYQFPLEHSDPAHVEKSRQYPRTYRSGLLEYHLRFLRPLECFRILLVPGDGIGITGNIANPKVSVHPVGSTQREYIIITARLAALIKPYCTHIVRYRDSGLNSASTHAFALYTCSRASHSRPSALYANPVLK